MLPIRDFIGAVARKPFKEIEETVKKVYEDKALKKTQLNKIIRKVKEGKPSADQWQTQNPRSDFRRRYPRPGCQ
jgi:hypothetical protein